MSSDNNSEIAVLRNQVFTLLVALIVVSGTLTVFLYRQATMTRKDLDIIRPQVEALTNGFKQNEPMIKSFVNQLVAYGQTHPDFVPLLKLHGIPVSAPAGAVPAAPKK